MYLQITPAFIQTLRWGAMRPLEDLLLSIFMSSKVDMILILRGFAELPNDAGDDASGADAATVIPPSTTAAKPAVKPPSAKKNK